MAALAISQICEHRPASPTTVSTVPTTSKPQQIFRSALILRKSTKWLWEKEKTGMSDTELRKHLTSKGMNVNEMMENEKKQVNAVREIVARLEQSGICTRIVSRDELKQYLPEADLVISAGGDGTFLTAASVVNDDTPVVGINTDPIGSEGHLCAGRKNPPRDLIEQLVTGKLKFVGRSRIRVTVKYPKSSFFSLKCRKETTSLALNEVFIGEDEAAKVSTYNISIDDSVMVKQKSSGMIVSTGTGSTSWYSGMNRVDETTVNSIIETMQNLGINISSNRDLVKKITNNYNQRIPFEVDFPSFAFYIREPIFNATFKRTAQRGFAQKIRLESRCSNGYLVLDGSNKIPFPHGAVATLEIRAADALQTVIV